MGKHLGVAGWCKQCARDVSWVHRVVLYLSEGDPTQSQLISHRVKEAFPRINWDWVHRNVDTTQIRRKMPLPRSGLEHLWPPQPPTAGAPVAAVQPQRSIMRMPPLPALSSHATQALVTPSAVACGARKATIMPTTSGRFQGTLAVHRVQHTGVVEVRETVLRLIPARRLCIDGLSAPPVQELPVGMYVVVAQFPPSIYSQWAVRASLGVVGNEGRKYDHPLRLLPVQPEGTHADGDTIRGFDVVNFNLAKAYMPCVAFQVFVLDPRTTLPIQLFAAPRREVEAADAVAFSEFALANSQVALVAAC